MPDLPISGLTAGNPAQSADLLPADRSGSTIKITAGSIAALSGVSSGDNIVMGQRMLGGQSDQRNHTIFLLISGTMILHPVSAFKLVWNVFSVGSTTNISIGQMAILRTTNVSTTVLDSTPFTIGGSGTPTISVPSGASSLTNQQVITTDTINLALDSAHDYWVAVYFSDVANNSLYDIANCNTAGFPYFFVTGNHVGDSTISGFVGAFGTGHTLSVLMSQVVAA